MLDGSEQISDQLAPIFREPIFEKQFHAICPYTLSQPLTAENLIKNIKIACFSKHKKLTRTLMKAIVDNSRLYEYFIRVLSKSDEWRCFSDEFTKWCKDFKDGMKSILVGRPM
jgi:hypothetical protein